MTIAQIEKILQGIAAVEYDGSPEQEIHCLLTDSRRLGANPAETLFFAIRTAKDDGARYIDDLRGKGVHAFVRENAVEALQALAAYKRSLYDAPVIGITGSHGKTVVKEWLFQLLKVDYNITRSPRSYNSQIGVPLSVWQLGEPDPAFVAGRPSLAIFEAGISRPGEMAKLEPIIRPTIGVITYIGEEHDAEFVSLEQKRQEKMLLFARCPLVIEDSLHQNVRTCAAVMRALGYDEQTISGRLMTQTHATVMQINLSALLDNVRWYKQRLQPTTRLTCMVKAFAYGSGSVEVSRALQQSGLADYLAVAVADEGEELRRAGITLPVITMNPEEAALDKLIENNLQPSVYSWSCLERIVAALRTKGVEHFPVHIKVDTGMHRLGFDPADMDALALRLRNEPSVLVVSVFSHLAAADEPQWDDFTRQQIHCFRQAADRLEKGLGQPLIKHILNSAGIERFADSQMDMVRLGIGMYGLAVEHTLHNVCTLKTTILTIKTVKAGETIGYGRHTRFTENRKIGIIPIGYADGFDRRFSNYGGDVWVRGHRCPVVGNVCMDQAMVDITDSDAREGDQVIVFGNELPLTELADRLGTIPYEILTSVSRRVQRQYLYR